MKIRLAMYADKLKIIATELISQLKKSVTIEWTLRERESKDQGDD